ncbi:MAG: response regulator receiver [Mucilaginibacter sp.]|jgi:DNA-binding response OmpR family regulator|nr:response regulator receiver [Mucilaginibacter sp.]
METILVQETDADTLEVLTVALQMKGYRVCSLTNQNENILDMIRRHHPKLVLLDCWLSHYSGKQISHWIKAHFPRLPVIAFSCDNHIDQEYQKLGFDGYLKKPFDLDVLYQAIEKYLPRHNKYKTAEPA